MNNGILGYAHASIYHIQYDQGWIPLASGCSGAGKDACSSEADTGPQGESIPGRGTGLRRGRYGGGAAPGDNMVLFI